MNKKLNNQSREEMIEIAAINRDHTQLRVEMSSDAVNDYAEIYSDEKRKGNMPPIVVFEDPESDELYLGNGFHRCEALESVDRKKVLAEIRPGTREDAIVFAATANNHNAVRFSHTDKRNAVAVMWREIPNQKIRWYAEQCEVAYGLAQDVIKKCKEGKNPLKADARAEDDKTPVRKTTIEKFATATASAERYLNKIIDDGEYAPSDELLSQSVALLADMARNCGLLIIDHADELDHALLEDPPQDAEEYVDADDKSDADHADQSEPVATNGRVFTDTQSEIIGRMCVLKATDESREAAIKGLLDMGILKGKRGRTGGLWYVAS